MAPVSAATGAFHVHGPRPAVWSRREQAVFALCCAAVALHAVVDMLIAPPSGVGRAETLAAWLVPVGFVTLAVVLYPRLRPGLRALLGLVIGVLSLVEGWLAVSGLRGVNTSPGDWAGLLLLPAGLVLVALGVWLLWTSRRRTGHVVLRRLLLAVLGLVALYELVLPIAFAQVATERAQQPLTAPELGRPHQAVRVTTAEGIELGAWYVPSQNGAAVITLPREGTQQHARLLAEQGYGVLALDLEGYGDSQGLPNRFGYGNDAAVRAGIVWLEAAAGIGRERVGGLGLSVGGEQMIDAGARDDGPQAVVSEGAGVRSWRETFVREGPSTAEKALQFPHELVLGLATWTLSGDAPPPSLEQQAARVSPRALFLIYGEQGQAVEPAVNPPYHAAAGDPRELWEVPGAGHTGGLAAQPDEYGRRVLAFFDRELLGDR